ncbi:hypothetical protein Pan44_13480 [Caulifigura coniformis]|uniref:Uncharacterized protein n=1 Tax=Caulifigura coniformis TaxID=2527983 RepID=A0A517SB46_9PLAN|nr:hypothetical protein [Caulifigura coniformis]QDT53332.1 hypothetical protein Pan44_13480 [Caulifigura coniformis]
MAWRSSFKAWPAILIAAVASFLAGSAAHGGSMTFLAPREGMVRHNGALIRGAITLITADQVVVTPRGGAETSYEMSGVTMISAADNSFKYYPAQETFDEFLAKSSKLQGVTIVRDAPEVGSAAKTKNVAGASDGYARMIGMQPAATSQVTSSGGGFAQSGGFAGASQQPKALAKFDAPSIPELDADAVAAMERERSAAGNDSAVTAVPPTGQTPGSAGEEVLICSNPACGKEVRGAKYGGTCPHCGIVWAQQPAAEIATSIPPGSSTPVTNPANPFATPAATPFTVPVTPAPATTIPAVAAQPQGFSLETMPWWGKLLAFGASIMVLMFVMGRR